MDSKQLGTHIRKAREQLGWSQEELAAALEKDEGSSSESESGKRRLSAIDLPEFARVLQVPLLYFYEGEVSESGTDRQMLTVFHQLPSQESRLAIIDIIDILAKRF